MRFWTALLILAWSGSSWAAISGTPVQCSNDERNGGTTTTVDNADGWATPTSGNILLHYLAIQNAGTATSAHSNSGCPTGFTLQQSSVGGGFDAAGFVCTKYSDGTETSFNVTWTTTSSDSNQVACEFSVTDLATGGPVASSEDQSEVGTIDKTAATGSASNTVNDALAIAITSNGASSLWDNSSFSNSFITRFDEPATVNSISGVQIATKILTATASNTTTNTTTDTGEVHYGAILIFDGATACVSTDLSPLPGGAITISGCSLSGNAAFIREKSSGDQLAVSANAATTGGDWTIWALTEFASGQTASNQRFNNTTTWEVCTSGGSNCQDLINFEIDPPSTAGTDFFGQMSDYSPAEYNGSIFYHAAFSGNVTADDYFCVESSGTFGITDFGIVTGFSSTACRWYDVSATDWSAITSFDFDIAGDTVAPIITALIAATNYGAPPNDDNVGLVFQTDEANGTAYNCASITAADVDTAAEIVTCAGALGGSVAVVSSGAVGFTTPDLPDGTYSIAVVHRDVNTNDSNLLTESSLVIDTTAPVIDTCSVTNLNRAGTVTLQCDFDDDSTDSSYWCSGQTADGAAEIIANGTTVTHTTSTNTFNDVAVSGQDAASYCHLTQTDAYINEQVVSVGPFDLPLQSSYEQVFTDSDLTNDDGSLATYFTGAEVYSEGIELDGTTDLDALDLSALGLDDRVDEFAFHIVLVTTFAHNADKGENDRILTVNDASTSDFLEVYFTQTTDVICAAIVTNTTAAETACTTLNDLQYASGDILNIRAKKDSGGISLWVDDLTRVDNSNVNADANWSADITTASLNEDESGTFKGDIIVKGFRLYDFAPADTIMDALKATAFNIQIECPKLRPSPTRRTISLPTMEPICAN